VTLIFDEIQKVGTHEGHPLWPDPKQEQYSTLAPDKSWWRDIERHAASDRIT